MQLKNFIEDLNFIITDLETTRTSDAEIKLMNKILSKLRSVMIKREKTQYNNQLREFKDRLKQIKTIDDEIKSKLAELGVFKSMFQAVDEVKKDGNQIQDNK